MFSIDLELWRVGWGLWAAAGGLAAVLVFRRRPDRALALVMLGCSAWAIWILPVHQQAGVLFWVPLVAVAAGIIWFVPRKVQPAMSRPLAFGRDALAVRMDLSLLWVLSVITVGGVWLAVPETAVNVVIMMAVVPVAGVAWWDADHPPWTVNLGILMLVALGSISGAGGRTAWIGGLACAGLIPFRRRELPWWLVLTVHWLVVLAACRIVSRWDLVPTVLGSLGLVGGGWAVIEASERSGYRQGP